MNSFNSQPPEGGWEFRRLCHPISSGFNSQPPEGGWASKSRYAISHNRFNSQPPEGGWQAFAAPRPCLGCFNSQPPEGGWPVGVNSLLVKTFQLTAARRRLAPPLKPLPNKACIALFR